MMVVERSMRPDPISSQEPRAKREDCAALAGIRRVQFNWASRRPLSRHWST